MKKVITTKGATHVINTDGNNCGTVSGIVGDENGFLVISGYHSKQYKTLAGAKRFAKKINCLYDATGTKI